MGATEVEVNPIGLEVLKTKHENGRVAEIHAQLFFELEKESCPVCDLKSDAYFKLYYKEAKRQVEKMKLSFQATAEVSMIAADKLSNRQAHKYNPKSAPAPVEVKCSTCGNEEKVSDSNAFGSKLIHVEINPFTCSSCWWQQTGSKL